MAVQSVILRLRYQNWYERGVVGSRRWTNYKYSFDRINNRRDFIAKCNGMPQMESASPPPPLRKSPEPIARTPEPSPITAGSADTKPKRASKVAETPRVRPLV